MTRIGVSLSARYAQRAQRGFVGDNMHNLQAKKLMAEVAELQGIPNHSPSTPLSTPRPTHVPAGRPTLLVLCSLLAMALALWHFYHSQPVGVVKKVL